MSDEEQLIKIEIFDIHASSTILKVFPSTTASYVCEAIANKIDVTIDQIKFYNLILLITWINEFNNKTYTYLRTIKSNEKVISTYYHTLKKLTHKLPAAARRILKRNSINHNTIGLVGSTGEIIPSNDSLNHIIKTKWIYKDMRTTPLDFMNNDEVSANSSSSEDEEEISIDDLSYLQQFERRSYLLCRSKKDQNLWKKRFCVLVDNLWCIDYRVDSYYYSTNHNTPIARRKKPKAKCIKIKGNFRIYDKVKGFDYPYCIALQLPSTGYTQNLIFLRGMNESDQALWIHDIQKRAIINLENEQIHMAELIMSDEVNLQSDRIVKDMTPTLDNIFQYDMMLTWQYNNMNYDNIQYDIINNDNDNDSWFADSDSSPGHDNNMNAITSNDINTESLIPIESLLDIPIDNYIDEEILENDIIAIHKNLDNYIIQLNNQNDNRYSILSSLPFHIHRYCNFSLLHRLHYKHPKIITMLQFINDVNKYKHYHRLELFPTSRQLWILTMTIYEKYLLNQLTLFNQYMSMSSESDNQINGYIDNQFDSPVTSKKGNNIDNNVNSNKNNFKSYKSKLMNQHIGYWDIESNVLLEVHGKIFHNINRQIAGFNVLNRSNSNHNLSYNSYQPDALEQDDNQIDNDVNTVTTESSNGSYISPISWIWGNTKSTIDNKSNISYDSDINNNSYISLDELTLKTNHYTTIKENNKAMYQIVNMNELPSIDLFDTILYQVVLKIKLYCNHFHQSNKFYDKTKRVSSNTINNLVNENSNTSTQSSLDNNDNIIN